MYHGLGEIVNGFSKNAYSVFAGSVVRAAIAGLFASVVHLLPWAVAVAGIVGVIGNPETAVAVITLGMVVLTRVFLYSALGFSVVSAALLHPLEALVVLFVFIRSTILVGVRRNIRWRGRRYPDRITTFGEVD